MKHSMMRAAVAATLGFAALAANAGQIGVNVGATLAAEYITAAAVVKQPTITYQTASLINDGAAVQVHVRFSAGSLKAADSGAIPAVGDIKVYYNGAVFAPAAVTAVTIDNDGQGYYFTVTAGAGGIPAGAVVNISNTTAKIAKLSSALSAGGTVTTTVGYTATAGDYSAVTTWVEAPSTATLLQSAKYLSQVTLNSGVADGTIFGSSGSVGAVESQKVDVGTSLKKFTNASLTTNPAVANLGYVGFNSTSNLKTTTGGTPSIADFGSSTIAATGDFSGVGTTATPAIVTLNSAANCSSANDKYTAVLSADKKTATFSAVTAANLSTGLFLCYNVDTKAAIPFNVQFAIGGASTDASNGGAEPTIASAQSGANVYFLKSNGAAVTVPAFVTQTGPLGTGYNTYLRVVNTGNLTTPINVAAYNSTTGVVGTPSVLIASLPAGASQMLDTATITTALGLTAGSWNSLLVTGSTSQLAAQPLLVNPQGVITNLSSVNGGNNAAASN